MQLYFIRHGQSANNAISGKNDLPESSDPELTEVGRRQAVLLAEYIQRADQANSGDTWNSQNRSGFRLTRLYTSPMLRAVETAASLAAVLKTPWYAWPELHEAGGIYSREKDRLRTGLPGAPRSFFEQNHPDLVLPDWIDEQGWWQSRDFEPQDQVPPRAGAVLAELLARHGDRAGQPEQRIAFVSHGDFFVHLICILLDLPWRHAFAGRQAWFLMNNTGVTRIDIFKDEFVLLYMNQTSHLPETLIT
jgi:broad specificity phosphatase PhoE